MDFPAELNPDLTTYSNEDLASLIEAGNAALDAVLATENPSPADVAEARRLSAAVASLEDENASRGSAAAEMEELRAARIEAAANADAGDEGDEDEDDDDTEDGDDEGDEDADTGDTPGEETAATEAAVVAAGRRAPSARARAAGRKPRKAPAAAERGGVVLTAAAEVAGYSAGQVMPDLAAVAQTVIERVSAFPKVFGEEYEGVAMQRYGVAQIRKPFKDDEWLDGSTTDLERAAQAGKESSLPGGSLAAAGGWCAPSETIYDLCAGETTDGIIDLPERGIKRGGIRFTSGPDFSTLYSSTGFTQTEAQNIANTSKGCYTVPCPSFSEVRLDAVGLCIKAGILQDTAWPELTKRVISGALIAHEHRQSAAMINKMVTASGTAVVVANMGSVASSTLAAAELVTEQLREQYRLGQNQTLEAVFPVWVRGAIRADLAHRNGVDLLSVTDQQIQSHFAARKVRTQWVYNWQQLVEGEEGYPATFQFMAYPAGTFVKGTASVIKLDAVYDAASLDVNTYTGLFMEEGQLLLQQCWKSKLVTVSAPIIGRTGPAESGTAAAGASFTLT